jgi:hypothetical protein
MGRASAVVAVWVVAGLVAAAAPPAAGSPEERPERSISEDTTWTRAGSPYVLDEIVVVEPGVTLTIEPGVHVEVLGIRVEGALHAEGTDSEPIVFSNGDGDRWGGIFFRTSGASSASVVRDARIENGVQGIYMGRDAFPIQDTVFTGNGVALEVDNPDANVSFTGNAFYSNDTAFVGKTTGLIGIYENDFWDNDVSLMLEAQSPYSCGNDPGMFDVHYNDILRGPDDEWFSFDVRTSEESRETGMVVDASSNWWGTTEVEDIRGRLQPQINCCPVPDRTPVAWLDPAPVPQTAAEPPGPVGTPERQPSGHGDPLYIVDIRKPDWGDCFTDGALDRLRGVVTPALGPMPERLPVSLVKGLRRCKSYEPRTARFVRTECGDEIVFEVAVRDGRWRVKPPRPLRFGRYTLVVGEIAGDVSRFRVLR